MQLNYFPIKFEFDSYKIQTEPYSEERLNELRGLYNTTHSFFRNGDTIYISNKDGDEIFSTENLIEKRIYEDNHVTSSLIKHLFFRTFKERFPNYVPVDFYPFRFFSEREKDDIIYSSLPNDLKNKIAYKKLIEVQLRLTEINGVKQFGFLINIKRNWIFTKSCKELHAEGFGLIGIDVLHSESVPGINNVLAPNEELIGIITEIEGNHAKIETNDGIRTLPLEQLFIKKSKFNIGKYLTFALSEQKSGQIMELIERKKSDIYNPKKLYDEILNISNHLFHENGKPILFYNKDGFCFSVDKTPLVVSNSIDLSTPTFIFDPAATKTNNTSPDIGLSNYGPYDSTTFDIKTPNVLCICNRTNRGNFTRFLSNLKDGLPQSRYFQKGLQKKYDLQDVIINIRETQGYSTEEYLKAISNYDENKPHLAIIEIPASFKRQNDQINPYYQIKAKLLSLEIPVQFVTSEIMSNHNEYILNSIALQIYAKLGGTPWVLPTQRSVDKEIIIGIGHSWMRRNQYSGAEQNRVVGITTFMSSDGQYLLGDKVKDVPFENYFAALLKSLKQSIQRLSTEQGWQDRATVRLIFHIFKPIKNTEFDVISQLVREISQYKIKFAFVTISNIHPTIIFDTNQRGFARYGSSDLKGELIPNRGSNIILDDKTCIVQMLGPKELKTSNQGMSKPILINIRTPQGNYNSNELNDLLFYDLRYITQQIFSFTYLSWRSFLPGEEPATMKYSNLISRLLGKMRNVPNWDADNLNYGLKRKKWFPLNERADYSSRIKNSPKLSIFSILISAKALEIKIPSSDLNETDEIYLGMVNAILKNDKADFLKNYELKSKSRPTKDSAVPFVNDDFFIFSVILGVTKFSIEKTWISYIISIRTRNTTTITFENILNENYFSTSNHPEIIFIFLQLNDDSRFTNEFINLTYKRIIDNTTLFENRSDFHILCTVRTYDLIILLKDTPAGSEISLLRKFNKNFISRIKYLSWGIQIVLFASLIYFILQLSKYSPESVAFIDQYNYAFTIYGSLGLSMIGNFIPFFRKKSQQIIMRILGYPNQLIKEAPKT